MTNECTVLDIGWIILSEQPTCKTILPKFISMENNLTATTRKYMHAETLALLTKPLYFPNVFKVVVMVTR
jgi:hypothetical protein